jgi:drug/metabolite transporter (DMT)-like permease
MTDSNNPIKAAIWMLGAIASFSTMAIAGRSLDSDIDTFEIMLFRSIVGVIIVVTIARSIGTLHEIKFDKLRLHLLRNLCHFTGQNLWVFALTAIPLSQLFAFEFSTPIWVAILAPIFLKEKLTRARTIAAIMGFIGILLVARPDTATYSPYIIAAFLCAIGFAGANIGTKLLTRTQSITCIMFWLTVIQTGLGLIAAGHDGDIYIPPAHNFIWLFIIGVCGLTAHFSLTRALSLAPAIVVSPFDFLRLPLISIVAFFLYGEVLEWPVFLGAVIVFSANIFNILSELKQRKKLALQT